jgi:hypothetical protein
LDYLHENFRVEDQLNAYAETILNAEAAAPMQYQFSALGDETLFRLPIWCYRAGAKGIYHDYLVTYYHEAALETLLDQYPKGFQFADAEAQGSDRESVLTWYRDGYLVPMQNTL